MSRSFLTPINLNQLELQNARIQNLSTTQINAISSPVEGQLVYDNSIHQLKVWSGEGWVPVGGAATGAGAPDYEPQAIGSLYLDLTNLLLYVSSGTEAVEDWVPVEPRGELADISYLGSENDPGSSLRVANADHIHRHTDDDHATIHLNALATATGDYSMGTYKLTNVGNPESAQDVATKSYVDATAQGLIVNASVEAATYEDLDATYTPGTEGVDGGFGIGATLTMGANGAFTLDDWTATEVGQRVLVRAQTDATENGIYTVTTIGNGSTPAVLTRATDFDNGLYLNVSNGDFVFVEHGSLGGTGWVQTNQGAGQLATLVVGTDDIIWFQFSGAGTYVNALNGALDFSGMSIAVKPGLGITTTAEGDAGAAVADTVAINTDVVVRKYAATIGNGSSNSITVTHNLNTQDVTVGVYDTVSYAEVFCDVIHASVNTITLSFAVAPDEDAYRVVIHG